MNWTGWSQSAGVKMKRFDPNHSSVEPGIRLQEFPERLSGDIPAARECNMRMPRTKFRLETSSERGFLHSLVNLKQVWVRLADADPDNFRHAVCRERSDANNRQKEGAELDRAEFFAQRRIDIVWHIIEFGVLRGSSEPTRDWLPFSPAVSGRNRFINFIR